MRLQDAATVLALSVATVHSQLPFAARRTDQTGLGSRPLLATNLTVVPGIFRQSTPLADDTSIDGQLSNAFTSMRRMNDDAGEGVTYKLLYVGRHGEGWHNVAEAKYTTPLWDCHYARLDGDGELAWADAALTPRGEAQADTARARLAHEKDKGMPMPHRVYASPLRRALATAERCWAGLVDEAEEGEGCAPAGRRIREDLRESIGVHTCDRRSDRRELEALFPTWWLSPSFAPVDPLWTPAYRESAAQQALRLRLALVDVFATDPAGVLGIVAHGGTASALFAAVGHPSVEMRTGGVVPLLIRATADPTATMSAIVGGQSDIPSACRAALVPCLLQLGLCKTPA
ncbi:putative phosphoglycerate mutase pmu1 [Cryptotrichosporon argae]